MTGTIARFLTGYKRECTEMNLGFAWQAESTLTVAWGWLLCLVKELAGISFIN